MRPVVDRSRLISTGWPADAITGRAQVQLFEHPGASGHQMPSSFPDSPWFRLIWRMFFTFVGVFTAKLKTSANFPSESRRQPFIIKGID